MFNVGEVVPTSLALKRAKGLQVDLLNLISRYSNEDWPDMTEYEKKLNRDALENDRPVYGRYKYKGYMFIFHTDFKERVTRISMLEELK